MKRYKLKYEFTNGSLDDAKMVECSRGEWVKYEDIAAALNIVGRLSKESDIDLLHLGVINGAIREARLFYG